MTKWTIRPPQRWLLRFLRPDSCALRCSSRWVVLELVLALALG